MYSSNSILFDRSSNETEDKPNVKRNGKQIKRKKERKKTKLAISAKFS